MRSQKEDILVPHIMAVDGLHTFNDELLSSQFVSSLEIYRAAITPVTADISPGSEAVFPGNVSRCPSVSELQMFIPIYHNRTLTMIQALLEPP